MNTQKWYHILLYWFVKYIKYIKQHQKYHNDKTNEYTTMISNIVVLVSRIYKILQSTSTISQ